MIPPIFSTHQRLKKKTAVFLFLLWVLFKVPKAGFYIIITVD